MPQLENQWKPPWMATANDKNKGEARWQAQGLKFLELAIDSYVDKTTGMTKNVEFSQKWK